MPTELPASHADLMRRLDELPISNHERHIAKTNAALAFGIVDTIADAVDGFRALMAPTRRQATRTS
jgi:hypothetical protein